MKRNKIFTFFVALAVNFPLLAGTQYYRLSYRDDPSTTIVIGWSDKGTSANAKVYYGTTDFGTNYQSYPSSQAVDRSETNFKGLNHRFARLGGLIPDTKYFFVIKDDQETSARMIFKTLPGTADVPITFIAGGDSRTGFITEYEYSLCRPRRQDANKLVGKIRPAFIAFSGDFVYSVPPLIASTNGDWADWLSDWQLTIAPDGQLFPVIPTFGNHEETMDVYNIFDIPNSNTYYSLGIGGNLLRIYTLNTEIDCDAAQKTWLENDLQLHTANSNEPYWKMAQYHYPFVPHSNYSPNTTMINCWANFFQDYKIRLVSEAHAHIIKVTWPILTSSATGSDNGFIRNDSSGIVYIGEGSWGAPMRDLYTYYSSTAAYNWTRNQEKMPGLHVVCVSKEKLEVRTLKIDNVNNVGQNTDNELPCTLPFNAPLWNPSNGSVITLINPDTTTVGVPRIPFKEIAHIFPNPTNDVVRIHFLETGIPLTIEVYNSLGRLIRLAQTVSAEDYFLELTAEGQGVYFIYIRGKEIFQVSKVHLLPK